MESNTRPEDEYNTTTSYLQPLANDDSDPSAYLEPGTRPDVSNANSAYLAVIVPTDEDAARSAYLTVVAGLHNENADSSYLADIVNTNDDCTNNSSYLAVIASLSDNASVGHGCSRSTLASSINTTPATVNSNSAYAEVEDSSYEDLGEEYTVGELVGVSDSQDNVILFRRLRFYALMFIYLKYAIT